MPVDVGEMPDPLDPATNNVWGQWLIAAITALVNGTNSVEDQANTLSGKVEATRQVAWWDADTDTWPPRTGPLMLWATRINETWDPAVHSHPPLEDHDWIETGRDSE